MSEILWVAELGSAHKGDKSLAFEMIRQAAGAGATICKFQFGWTKAAQIAQGKEYLAARYVDDWAEDLNKWCEYFGVELMASIWSMEGLETARRVKMKRYKIAHQVTDRELIKAILSDGKETFRSGELGYWRRWKPIFCTPEYPTYPNQFKLPWQFSSSYWYGYSDHTHGIGACLLAVSREALYIEKHFCLDKTDLVTRDTPFSATPDEFSEMVRIGNEMRRLLDTL